jgi:four helix bundle protein
MDSKKYDLRKRTKEFSLSVMTLCRKLPPTPEARVVMNQVLRSATSVGANYRAAQRSRSRAEFVSKMGVVIEEADETLYWLEMIRDGGIVVHDSLKLAIRESEELLSIFVASQLTAKNKSRDS